MVAADLCKEAGMRLVVEIVLTLLALPTCLVCAYLGMLALLARRSPPSASAAWPAPAMTFDIIVPAHDEARGIVATIASLSALDYPAALRRIVVVADNCSDDTAALARLCGAHVLERHAPEQRGKGYALAFAFEHGLRDGFASAFVVVDADSVVSSNLLAVFARRFAAGAMALQADYGVRNPRDSWRTRLMCLAFALFHRVRSLARQRLRLSVGLRGNGMGFSAELIRHIPHQAFSIVEDAEYGIQIGLAGHRVEDAGEAHVLGDMPADERSARSQRRRWEHGRFALLTRHGPILLRRAWHERSRVLLDLAVDLIVPPLSYVALLTTVGMAASLWLGRPLPITLFAAAAAGLSAYVLRGWSLSGLGLRGAVDLLCAPYYVFWKLWLLVRRDERKSEEWVRTRRAGE